DRRGIDPPRPVAARRVVRHPCRCRQMGQGERGLISPNAGHISGNGFGTRRMADLIDIRIPEADPSGVAISELITDIGTITIAAAGYFEGDILVTDRLHIEGLWAGALGLQGLYRIACQVLRRLVG